MYETILMSLAVLLLFSFGCVTHFYVRFAGRQYAVNVTGIDAIIYSDERIATQQLML